MTRTPSAIYASRLKRMAIALAGASLLTLAACSDEDTSANAIVQPDAGQSDAPQSSGEAPAASQPAGSTGEAAEPTTGTETAAATSDESTLKPAAEAPESSGSVDVSKLMAEQALPDIVEGDPNAPVTIVEYASMTCSHCADFHENSYPAIKKAYLDTGKAKLIIREFPFDPRSLAAFMLARCAGDDAKRTALVDVLFSQQRSWASADNASEALLQIARMAGIGQDEFVACLNNKDLQEKIVAVQQVGQNDFGVEATPTFFINGAKYSGSLSAENMAAAIEAATPTN